MLTNFKSHFLDVDVNNGLVGGLAGGIGSILVLIVIIVIVVIYFRKKKKSLDKASSRFVISYIHDLMVDIIRLIKSFSSFL